MDGVSQDTGRWSNRGSGGSWLNIWAGQLPIEMATKPLVPDGGNPDGVVVPPYVTQYPSRRIASEHMQFRNNEWTAQAEACG